VERSFLDVRKLAPPEPMEQILDALADLPPSRPLWVLHRREPFPLYDLLKRLGYCWLTRGSEDCFEILIWATDHPPSAEDLAWSIPC
jgi:hypothetical protein